MPDGIQGRRLNVLISGVPWLERDLYKYDPLYTIVWIMEDLASEQVLINEILFLRVFIL